MDAEIIENMLEEVQLFSSFNQKQKQYLTKQLQIKHYGKDDILFELGSTPNAMYFLVTGAVALTLEQEDKLQLRSQIFYNPGQLIGLGAMADRAPRSAQAKAVEKSQILVIPYKLLEDSFLINQKSEGPFFKEYAKSTKAIILALNQRLEKEMRAKIAYLNKFMQVSELANLLFIFMTMFVFFLPKGVKFYHIADNQIFLTVTLFSIMLAALYSVLYYNKLPFKSLKLLRKTWLGDIYQGFIYTLPIIIALFLLKLSLVTLTTKFSQYPIIDLNAVDKSHHTTWFKYATTLLLYIYSSLAQELFFRGGFQQFFTSLMSYKQNRFLPILYANILFSFSHIVFSYKTALLVFLPGLFFGWIFDKTKSTMSAFISHFLVGGVAFFVFGLQILVLR